MHRIVGLIIVSEVPHGHPPYRVTFKTFPFFPLFFLFLFWCGGGEDSAIWEADQNPKGDAVVTSYGTKSEEASMRISAATPDTQELHKHFHCKEISKVT